VILTSKILTTSALLILLVLPVSAFPTSLLSNSSIKDTDSTSLPFDSANNLIVITATLNGRGPFRFLLDTGASHHVMKPEIAQALGLKVTDFGELDAGGRGRVRAGSVRVSKLQVGGFTLEKQQFAVTSFPSSYPFEGFLGAELFKRFIVTIDFKHSLITLAQPNAFRYQGTGVSLSIKFYEGLIPQVKGEVDNLAGWFKIDTGYNGSLALFGKFIDENRLLAKYPPQTSAPGGLTLTGEVGDSPTTQVRQFRLGNLTLQNVLTSFFLEKEGSNSAFAGAVGTVLLRQYKVIIDYKRQRVVLERRDAGASAP
jgi:predicted aspartyl protease